MNGKESYKRITRKLMERAMEESKGENVVFSPMSVITLLSVVADAASGESRDEILNALGLRYDELMAFIGDMGGKGSGDGTLVSFTAVCVKKEIGGTIREGYAEHLGSRFNGELLLSDDIVTDVNLWVKENTNGMIEEIADKSMDDMVACMLNAISFRSVWKKKYTDENISEGFFHNSDGSVTEVNMLHSGEDVYVADSYSEGFVKPYEDGRYAFMALLPRESMEEAVRNIDFSALLSGARWRNMCVAMPKFTSETSLDLSEWCKSSGITSVFSPEADLSRMTTIPLQLDAVVHKARIEVNRAGTEAAAVTMATMHLGGVPYFLSFDRPFVYGVMDLEKGVPVFAGICSQAGESAK